ncbi:unnamed protein product [Gongylonema pulchrum]|uniref:Secreted protein n=1 Tax=Gongylonema pulchrum TaxID=637853 RepID=A0A183D2F7_9BILA|nr:unnamed protein product [Gongylonema pulchrum]
MLQVAIGRIFLRIFVPSLLVTPVILFNVNKYLLLVAAHFTRLKSLCNLLCSSWTVALCSSNRKCFGTVR